MNTKNPQTRTRPKRVATLLLASAAASAMLLPAGQGIAGATTAAPTGVGVVSNEKPVLGCGWRRHHCGHGWGHRWWGGHKHRHHGWGHRHHGWGHKHDDDKWDKWDHEVDKEDPHKDVKDPHKHDPHKHDPHKDYKDPHKDEPATDPIEDELPSDDDPREDGVTRDGVTRDSAPIADGVTRGDPHGGWYKDDPYADAWSPFGGHKG